MNNANDLLVNLDLDSESKYLKIAFNMSKIPKTSIKVTQQKHKNRNRENYTNSALATLGDSIIKMVLCEKLFLDDKDRAEITSERAELENDESLNKKARDLGLDKCIFASRNQESDQLPSDYATVYEAFIGAIYLEKGLEIVKKFLNEQF